MKNTEQFLVSWELRTAALKLKVQLFNETLPSGGDRRDYTIHFLKAGGPGCTYVMIGISFYWS